MIINEASGTVVVQKEDLDTALAVTVADTPGVRVGRWELEFFDGPGNTGTKRKVIQYFDVVNLPPVSLTAPTITTDGSPTVGEQITLNIGTWNYVDSYERLLTTQDDGEVLLDWGPITGPTNVTLISSYVNENLVLTIRATGPGGELEIASAPVGPIQAPVVKPDAVLLVVAGQSNARKSNTAALVGPARYSSLGTVKIWNTDTNTLVDYVAAGAAASRTSGHRGSSTAGGSDRAWGTEAEFIRQMRLDGDNRPVIVVKEAVNGTAINGSWAAPAGAQLTSLTSQLTSAITTAGNTYTIASKAMLWNQGEADANDTVSTAAFAAGFANTMAAIRTAAGSGLKVIIEQLRPLGYEVGAVGGPPASIARAYIVREAQAAWVAGELSNSREAISVRSDWLASNYAELHPAATYNDPTSGVIDTWIAGLEAQFSALDHGMGQRAYAAFAGTHDSVYGSLLDTVPNTFSFTNVTDAVAGSQVSSNIITPVNYGRRTTISITGGQFRILNWDDSLAVDWGSTATTIDPLQKVQVRGTASAVANEVIDVTLTIGTVSGSWSITTEAAPSSYLTQTTAYIAAVTAENGGSDAISAPDKVAIDDFIDTAINGATPFWSKLKTFYLGAMDSEVAARVDLIRSGSGGTGYSEMTVIGVNGPAIWTDGSGWSADGSIGRGSSLGFNPSGGGSGVSQNSIGVGAYYAARQQGATINDISDQQTVAGNIRLGLMLNDTGIATNITARLNGVGSTLSAQADEDGFYHANRSGATAVQFYGPSGTQIGTASTASEAISSTLVIVGKQTGTTSTAVLSAMWVSESMTAAEVLAFRNALIALLNGLNTVATGVPTILTNPTIITDGTPTDEEDIIYDLGDWANDPTGFILTTYDASDNSILAGPVNLTYDYQGTITSGFIGKSIYIGVVAANGYGLSTEAFSAPIGPITGLATPATFVASTTGGGASGAATTDFTTTGRQAGDILVVGIVNANQPVTISTPGWTALDSDGQGPAGVAGSVGVQVFYKVSNGTETTVTTTDGGDFQYIRGAVYRGSSGIQGTSVSGNGSTYPSSSMNLPTTTTSNSLIVCFIASDRDSATGAVSGVPTHPSLTFTERFEAGTSINTGGGIGLYDTTKISPGATTDGVVNIVSTSAANPNVSYVAFILGGI